MIADEAEGELLPALDRVYTHLGAHPELSMQEARTARITTDRLRGADTTVTEHVGETGVIGVLHNGEVPR